MNDKPKSLAPIAIPIHWLMSFIAWWPLFVSGGFSILKNDMKPQEFLFWISLVLGILVLTLLWSIVHYLRFTYLVAPDGLTINSGVFIRKINHIHDSVLSSLKITTFMITLPPSYVDLMKIT